MASGTERIWFHSLMILLAIWFNNGMQLEITIVYFKDYIGNIHYSRDLNKTNMST